MSSVTILAPSGRPRPATHRGAPRNAIDPPESFGRVDVGSSDQAVAFSSSAATLRVRLGSTWMPGPMVVETVTFLM